MSVGSWCSTCFCVVLCDGFCTGHFVMVPLNMTYLHCLQHYFVEQFISGVHMLAMHLLSCANAYVRVCLLLLLLLVGATKATRNVRLPVRE